jgi:single-strand DNA-binding protein
MNVMPSFSQTILIGHLGADPELRYTASGRPVANMSVATNHAWKDKTGTRHERTEWHRITVWGTTAENVQRFLHCGDSCMVQGRNETTEYTDPKGIRRSNTRIVADSVRFLTKANAAASKPPVAPQPMSRHPTMATMPGEFPTHRV